MANSVSYKAKDVIHNVNNGWKSELYSSFMMSGSKIANTKWGNLFMNWRDEYIQGHVGPGIVGIDIDNILWIADEVQQRLTNKEEVKISKKYFDCITKPELSTIDRKYSVLIIYSNRIGKTDVDFGTLYHDK